MCANLINTQQKKCFAEQTDVSTNTLFIQAPPSIATLIFILYKYCFVGGVVVWFLILYVYYLQWVKCLLRVEENNKFAAACAFVIENMIKMSTSCSFLTEYLSIYGQIKQMKYQIMGLCDLISFILRCFIWFKHIVYHLNLQMFKCVHINVRSAIFVFLPSTASWKMRTISFLYLIDEKKR